MLGSNPSACPDAEAGAEGWLASLSLPLLICFGFKAKNPKNELSLHRSAIWQYLFRGRVCASRCWLPAFAGMTLQETLKALTTGASH